MRSQDAIGIGLSSLCIVHCLALPVLISFAPALAVAEGEWVHLSLATLALVIAFSAMRNWPRGGRGLGLRGLAVLGLALLFFGSLAEISELAEQAVTVAGAALLASAHVLAWMAGRAGGGAAR